MPQTTRRLGNYWYRRVPCDPAPQTLAQRLADAQVAAKAAKRIDTFDRFHSQHVDHRRAVVRGLLGGIGLVLSVGPSVPALMTSCRDGDGGECALRLSAMAGGVLALGVTAWAFVDLYGHPVRLSEHIAKLNAEMSRAMHSRNGETAVDNLFDIYQSMGRSERTEFKALLHERARQPRTAEAAARADDLALDDLFCAEDLESATGRSETGESV